MDDPKEIYAQAKIALEANDLDTAERLFQQVSRHPGVGTQGTLFYDAIEGLEDVRQLRDRRSTSKAARLEQPSPRGSRKDSKRRPTLPDGETSQNTPPIEAAELLSPSEQPVTQTSLVERAGTAATSDTDLTFEETLAIVDVADAERTVAGYDQALTLLNQLLKAKTLTEQQRAEIVARHQAIAEQKHALEAINADAEPAVQAAATTLPPEAAHPAELPPALELDDGTQEHIQALAAEAQLYLERQTNANYKAVIALYERILSLSELTPEQRDEFERRRADATRQYEDFRAIFGELTTARQIKADQEELIVIRKLMNAGYTIGPDDEDLEEHFERLLATTRDKLLRAARERAERAQEQVADGIAFLDVQPLQSAISSYEQAMRLIQGSDIQGSDDTQETRNAVTGIRNLLTHETTRVALQDYQQRRDQVENARALIQRLHPMYEQARDLYKRGAYGEAIATLEPSQEIAERQFGQFSSETIDSLLRRAHQAWEQATITRTDRLLEQARAAASRGDRERVEQCVGEVISLEPQLQSEKLEQRKDEARKLGAGVRAEDEKVRDLLRDAGFARTSGNLTQAEKLARDALVLRPGYVPAHKVLDGVLYTIINAALREAEEALAAPNLSTLDVARSTLEAQRNHVGEIAELPLQKRLLDRMQETLQEIHQTIKRIRKLHSDKEYAAELVVKAGQLVLQDQYAEALKTLDEARRLDEQNPQIEIQEQSTRADWATFLKRRARALLDATPPNPAGALESLAILREIGLEDAQAAELRRRAERVSNKDRGLLAYQQGDYTAAIATLMLADLNDSDVRVTLREARRKEAQRLMGQTKWEEALGVLERADSTDPGIQSLISRARAELLLAQAEAARLAKDFALADARLSEAEKEPLDDLPARIDQLRQQINADRALFRDVDAFQQRANEFFLRYQSSGDRAELLKAINVLDEALGLQLLQAGDAQRGIIQALREEYRQRYQQAVTSERAQLLAAGDRALSEERLPDALRTYNMLLGLAPSGQDAEALERIERVRHRLRRLREDLVAETSKLLNTFQALPGQRGIRLGDVQALVARVHDAQQLDPEPHRSLNEALQALQTAVQTLQAAEADLNAGRVRWAAARQTGDLEFREAGMDLERALKHFNGRTYLHIELDHNSLESMARRMSADREAHRVAKRSAELIREALERGDFAKARLTFAELMRAETTIAEITVALAERDRVPNVIVPHSNPERYPAQYELLTRLAAQIKDLGRQAREATTLQGMRTCLARQREAQSMFEAIDPEDRFGLR